jgi:uncharacterized membrane protein YfcA
MDLCLVILALGLGISFLSGFLGIGGGIILAPALLVLPPLVGAGGLDVRSVTGLTITQGLFACLAAAIQHDRFHCVHRRLLAWMGPSILIGATLGSIASRWIPEATLTAVLAALALIASCVILVPRTSEEAHPESGGYPPVNVPLATALAAGVGLLGGMVGQGGSFILIPLMLVVLRLPVRLAVGTNLALVFFSSLAGFTGKALTGQIPFHYAAILLVGAIPGTLAGCGLSRRTSPGVLRRVLAVVIAVAAVKLGIDAIGS